MPVRKGNLLKEGKEKIRTNYKFLLAELDGKDLVDDLIQAKVFDFDDKEEICHQVSRKDRTDIFLQRLLRSGPYQAYDVFLQALRKEYPHVAETLDKTHVEENEGQLQEIYNSTHTNKDIAERKAIIKSLQENPFLDIFMIRSSPHAIAAPSFNMSHLPEGFRHQEVLDCVHSLAQQTAMRLGVIYQAGITFISMSYRSGRVWRVQRKFSTVDNKSCSCNECQGSRTPRKQWGEYIVLTHCWVPTNVKSDNVRFVFGFDSYKTLSDVSVLKVVSVIRNDHSLGFAEVLCISHDAYASKRVEDICHRNIVNREKLLNMCHLLQKDKKLAVCVSHPFHGPKHISVGEWLEDEWDQTSGCSRHVYTTEHGTHGSPVLLVDSGNASVTLHYRRDCKKQINKSCGYVWSL